MRLKGDSIHKKTYTLEIPMDHSPAVDVDQTPSHVSQLVSCSIVNELEAKIAID